MATFPQFSKLPAELQREIWNCALEDSLGPQVCSVKMAMDGRTLNLDWEHLLDYGGTAVARTCRESQAAAKAMTELNIGFRPKVDFLYIQQQQFPTVFHRRMCLQAWRQAAEVRHLAVDVEQMLDDLEDMPHFYQLEFVMDSLCHFGSLKTLSLCFNHLRRPARGRAGTSRPRRLRLRDFESEEDDWYPGGSSWRDIDLWAEVRHEGVLDSLREMMATMEVSDMTGAPYHPDTAEPLYEVLAKIVEIE
ncbi:hypothetical protein SCAR479_03734 [Seiridium cardinale]|uniref:2EXR domain-containing protein n=1 Tax=Seiridium cardinale TaxID=138064 RepID=A0ABR2XZM4_9PEZI